MDLFIVLRDVPETTTREGDKIPASVDFQSYAHALETITAESLPEGDFAVVEVTRAKSGLRFNVVKQIRRHVAEAKTSAVKTFG